MRSLILAVTLGGALALAPLPLPATTLTEAAAASTCSSGKICVWPKTGFRGARHVFGEEKFGTGNCYKVSFRSIQINTTDLSVLAYPNKTCHGGYTDYSQGRRGAVSNVDLPGRARSVLFTSSTPYSPPPLQRATAPPPAPSPDSKSQ